METKNRAIFSVLALSAVLFFVISSLWDKSPWLLLLVLLVLAIFIASFFFPRSAFIALLLLRTSVDFLTSEEVINLGGWSINFTSLVGVIVLIFGIVTFFKSKVWRNRPPLFNAWIAFLGLAFILTPLSLSPSASLVELLRWSSFFSLFILGFCLFRTSQQTTQLIKTLIFSSLIPAIVALSQKLNRQEFFDGERWRVTGTFVHPNMLAFYLVLAITLSLFVFLTLKKEAVQKYFYLFLICPLSGALFFTYTRGAWIALFIVIFIIGLMRFRWFLASALVIIMLGYFAIVPFQDRVNSLITFSAVDSTSWRLDLWRDAWGYAQNNLIIGTGPGTAPLVIAQNRSYLLGSSEPHNDYIKIILETGLIGLALYLFLICSLLWHLWQGFRRERFPRRRMLFLFTFVFAISFYISSIGDNILKDSSLQWSFWALNGALMYSYLQIRKDKVDMAVE